MSHFFQFPAQTLRVVYRQAIDTLFRMPIYLVLHQRNANPMTPNPGIWLVESNEARYEYWWEHISYDYLSNVKIINIDEFIISLKPRPLTWMQSTLVPFVLLTTLVLPFDRLISLESPSVSFWFIELTSVLDQYHTMFSFSRQMAPAQTFQACYNTHRQLWYVVMISLRRTRCEFKVHVR